MSTGVLWGAAPLTIPEARRDAARAAQWVATLNAAAADEFFHDGEWPRAVAAFAHVVELAPHQVEPYANAAWLLWSAGHYQEAMDWYARMLSANATDPAGYFDVGFFLTRYGGEADALPYLRAGMALGMPAPANHLFGHTLERLGRTEEALAFWQQLARQDPENAVATRALLRLLGGQSERPVRP
jgi:tetratricopeptide (TPR) repeat protein